MVVQNSDISEVFEQIADLMEIKGDNPFKIRAYRNAARTIGGMPHSVADMVTQGEDLSTITGIGKALAQKMEEIVATGTHSLLHKLKEELPADLLLMLKIPTLGPKRVKALHSKLGITTLEELELAARAGKIRTLDGFGVKTEQGIRAELERLQTTEQRLKLVVAEQIATVLTGYLKELPGLSDIEVAGSYRRRKETVGDLDILVARDREAPIMDHFTTYQEVERILMKGETKSSVVLRSGLQVDLRVVPHRSFGAALQYFTGSQTHNIAIRSRAQKMKLKVNEYGVFKGEEQIAGRSEEDVYTALGLPYIEPELRENRGEIEAALDNRLPRLVSLPDIQGELHSHTTYSDGLCSITEMALAAQARGYEYLAITDHSQRLTIAHGLTVPRLRQQLQEIDYLADKMKGIVLLKGIEVDILDDGSLDLPDEILRELDIVIGAVHSKFKLPLSQQTERIIKAMDNPLLHIIAHPSGRLINERAPYDVDMDKIITAARDRGCFLELNAYPDRLDLNDIYCKAAKEMGVKIAISTDAHSLRDLDNIRYGLGQARRGWLEPEDVLNTHNLENLTKLLQR
ncbi:DNA polymerase/3'-5' exonuclease PolX [candidate division CSSED10-310 bacterium]|uniref:DNA-directed DNA polymerase n=1 Tax=candidate division CSSED10-310 bacterium TaxID=2855610 RepID=A0ABV6YWP5_UNCC1